MFRGKWVLAKYDQLQADKKGACKHLSLIQDGAVLWPVKVHGVSPTQQDGHLPQSQVDNNQPKQEVDWRHCHSQRSE